MEGIPRPRLVHCAALAAVLACLGSCRTLPNLPRTYAVKGRVVYQDGTPLPGGMIDFRPTGPAAGSVTGQVAPDGTFSLVTRTDQGAAPGAPEGRYSVTVMPRQEGDQTRSHGVRPIPARQSYTVQPGDGNDFTITLDRPPPRH